MYGYIFDGAIRPRSARYRACGRRANTQRIRSSGFDTRILSLLGGWDRPCRDRWFQPHHRDHREHGALSTDSGSGFRGLGARRVGVSQDRSRIFYDPLFDSGMAVFSPQRTRRARSEG